MNAVQTHRHHMVDPSVVQTYLNGGFGKLTLVSAKTGTRFTYKIRRADARPGQAPEDAPLFVGLLSGTDRFEHIGLVVDGGTRWIPSRKVNVAAPSVKAWAWTLAALVAGRVPSTVEVWHEGTCCRCGRPLTVPESIASGIGPTCAGRGP